MPSSAVVYSPSRDLQPVATPILLRFKTWSWIMQWKLVTKMPYSPLADLFWRRKKKGVGTERYISGIHHSSRWVFIVSPYVIFFLVGIDHSWRVFICVRVVWTVDTLLKKFLKSVCSICCCYCVSLSAIDGRSNSHQHLSLFSLFPLTRLRFILF